MTGRQVRRLPDWLYGDDDLKARIAHLRTQQAPNAAVRVPP
jgi:hypothetical protein